MKKRVVAEALANILYPILRSSRHKASTAPRTIIVPIIMGIGNFFMYLPFVRELHRKYPDAHLVALVWKSRANLEVALKCGFFDQCITLTSGFSLSRSFGLAFARRPLWLFWRYSNSSLLSWLLVVCRPDCIIGYGSGSGYSAHHLHFFEQTVPYDHTTHEIVSSLRMLMQVENDSLATQIPLWSLPEARKRMENLLPPGIKILCHMGSSEMQIWKRLSSQSWADLLQKIMESIDCLIVFLGGRDEKPLVDEVRRLLGSEVKIIDLTGITSISEVLALFELSDYFIGIDSSMLHIASASGIQGTVFMGPTDFKRTRALSSQIYHVRAFCPCNVHGLKNQQTEQTIQRCGGKCMMSFNISTEAKRIITELCQRQQLNNMMEVIKIERNSNQEASISIR